MMGGSSLQSVVAAVAEQQPAAGRALRPSSTIFNVRTLQLTAPCKYDS